MKSGKQRRTEIQVQRAEQRDDAADAAAKLRLDERARNAKLANGEKARELALVSKRLHVNPANLGPNVTWGWPELVHRGYYVDQPFSCRACGKEQVWSATQQRWWFESAKGDVWTVAVHCRACRIKERERKNLARRTHPEGVARKRSDGAPDVSCSSTGLGGASVQMRGHVEMGLLSFALLSLAPDALAQPLCKPPEEVVFACQNKQGKHIAVCDGDSGVRYRFGVPGKVELDVRHPGASHPRAFRHYHYARAGVARTSLTIETEGALYEVFSEYERPKTPLAGVRVTLKHSDLQMTHVCAGKVDAHWQLLDGKVACTDQALNACMEPAHR